MRRLGVLVATVGGAGYIPVAPGTVGSALGVVIYLLTGDWPAIWQGALLLAICLAGTWASTEAARHFQREDPSHVVVDEVAGQLATLFMTGVGVGGAVVGFVLFRVLDIVKPWPARQFESLPGGVGIMADDVMAGVYGWALMSGGLFLLSSG